MANGHGHSLRPESYSGEWPVSIKSEYLQPLLSCCIYDHKVIGRIRKIGVRLVELMKESNLNMPTALFVRLGAI